MSEEMVEINCDNCDKKEMIDKKENITLCKKCYVEDKL